MRKIAFINVVLAFVLAVGLGSAFGGTLPDNGKLSGSHFQFNIIGHPNNNFSGDYSNGRTIMVPLKTDNAGTPMVCSVDGVVINDDEVPTYQSTVMGGVKLYFKVSTAVTNFQISDRDALDGRAEILVPASMLDANGFIQFDIYIRALGKPNTCMNINAWAYDLEQNLYFWAGSAYISRKTGKSVFVKANELFDVHYCSVVEGVCDAATIQEISVFDDIFESYFWQILNDGSRNVQVRIYPRPAAQ